MKINGWGTWITFQLIWRFVYINSYMIFPSKVLINIYPKKFRYEFNWQKNTLTMLFSEHWNCSVAITTFFFFLHLHRDLTQQVSWSKPSWKREARWIRDKLGGLLRPCHTQLKANHFYECLEGQQEYSCKNEKQKYTQQKKLLASSMKWKGREDGFGMKKQNSWSSLPKCHAVVKVP